MKTRIHRGWKWGVVLASIPLFLGIGNQSISQTDSGKATPPSAAPSTPATTPSDKSEPAAPEAEILEAEPELDPSELPEPPDIESNVSERVLEVGKLVQSGASEELILEFIKSKNGLELTADEIVYLQDLGLSEELITAVLKKDFRKEALAQKPLDTQKPAVTLSNKATPTTAAAVPANVPQGQSIASAATAPTGNPVPDYSDTSSQVDAAGGVTHVTNNYFYDHLRPYGSWIYVDSYGWCWRPTVAVVDTTWRPYHHRGRWVWTDYGWYWVSDYSWGYIPFHYGRWHFASHCGWVWVPGTVWGPAWVSWRYVDGYCGWAPLPPRAYYVHGAGFRYYGRSVSIGFDFGLTDFHYTFISINRFCDPRPWRHSVHHHHHHHHHKTVYRKSVVVNNYHSHGRERTFVNEGVGFDRVRRASSTEIQKVAVRDVSPDNRNARPGRMDREGNTPVVYRGKMDHSRQSETRLSRNAGKRDDDSSEKVQRSGNERSARRDGASSLSSRNNDNGPATATPSETDRKHESRGRSERLSSAAEAPSPGVAARLGGESREERKSGRLTEKEIPAARLEPRKNENSGRPSIQPKENRNAEREIPRKSEPRNSRGSSISPAEPLSPSPLRSFSENKPARESAEQQREAILARRAAGNQKSENTPSRLTEPLEKRGERRAAPQPDFTAPTVPDAYGIQPNRPSGIAPNRPGISNGRIGNVQPQSPVQIPQNPQPGYAIPSAPRQSPGIGRGIAPRNQEPSRGYQIPSAPINPAPSGTPSVETPRGRSTEAPYRAPSYSAPSAPSRNYSAPVQSAPRPSGGFRPGRGRDD